jgi:hypothetical protein
MKLLLALYFFILAIIQMGLLFGIYHYYRSQNTVRPNIYWLTSLATSSLALAIFGGGIITIDDISRPEFNFTIGNTLFYIAAVSQALFCQSLNRNVSRATKIILGVSAVLFLLFLNTSEILQRLKSVQHLCAFWQDSFMFGKSLRLGSSADHCHRVS